MLPSMADLDGLLASAKNGEEPAIEKLLIAYRDYLKTLAKRRIGGPLVGRVSASDIVQETMLTAWAEFTQFQGENAKQFSVWIRTILIRKVSAAVAVHLKAAKRSASREYRLPGINGSVVGIDAQLEGDDKTPSSIIWGREDASRLQQLLPLLPQGHPICASDRSYWDRSVDWSLRSYRTF
ncbi:MAG: hypothetical protein MUC83_14915 [Pirellula sp.]|nr:hypothetical protein [Pirellula sp.]